MRYHDKVKTGGHLLDAIMFHINFSTHADFIESIHPLDIISLESFISFSNFCFKNDVIVAVHGYGQFYDSLIRQVYHSFNGLLSWMYNISCCHLHCQSILDAAIITSVSLETLAKT